MSSPPILMIVPVGSPSCRTPVLQWSPGLVARTGDSEDMADRLVVRTMEEESGVDGLFIGDKR